MRILSILLGIGAAAVVALAWWGATALLQPSRRTLQDYHKEMLDQPRRFGLALHAFEVPAEKVGGYSMPCLLCEPDAGAAPGARGQILRKQLGAMGVKLAEFGTVRGTVVLLHGHKGRKEDGLPVAERFCAAGLRCILLDLPAQGDNANPIASFGLREWRLPSEAVREASKRFRFPERPCALWGISQGGAVAIQAAAQTPCDTLVVLSSFPRLNDVCEAQSRRLFGPLSITMDALMDRITAWRAGYIPSQVRPIDFARRLQMPVLIAHGTADTLIPLASGRQLYDALQSPVKRWLPVEGGTHDRVLTTPMPLYAEMTRFLLENMRPKVPIP